MISGSQQQNSRNQPATLTPGQQITTKLNDQLFSNEPFNRVLWVRSKFFSRKKATIQTHFFTAVLLRYRYIIFNNHNTLFDHTNLNNDYQLIKMQYLEQLQYKNVWHSIQLPKNHHKLRNKHREQYLKYCQQFIENRTKYSDQLPFLSAARHLFKKNWIVMKLKEPIKNVKLNPIKLCSSFQPEQPKQIYIITFQKTPNSPPHNHATKKIICYDSRQAFNLNDLIIIPSKQPQPTSSGPAVQAMNGSLMLIRQSKTDIGFLGLYCGSTTNYTCGLQLKYLMNDIEAQIKQMQSIQSQQIPNRTESAQDKNAKIAPPLPQQIQSDEQAQVQYHVLDPDQKRQQRSQIFQIPNPHLTCPSQNKVTHICINPTCQINALHCQNSQCPSCIIHQQNCCMEVPFTSITKILRNQAELKKQRFLEIADLQTKILELIKHKKHELQNKNFLGCGLDQSEVKILQSIYFNEDKKVTLKGEQASKLFGKLNKFRSQFNKRKQQQITYFKEQTNKITNRILSLQNQLIDKFAISNNFQFDSNIILHNSYEQIKYIQKALDFPKKLQLLFRASEHNFLASQFHRKCDGIQNTLTILKTQFGKTIAGFTPLKWQSPQSCTKQLEDPNCKSFLLNLNYAQKLKLTQSSKKQAINCSKSFGPSFGGGYDLHISDKCDKQANSHCAGISYSYNCENIYNQNQQSYTLLCGSKAGSNFKVLQYQVFKVVW